MLLIPVITSLILSHLLWCPVGTNAQITNERCRCEDTNHVFNVNVNTQQCEKRQTTVSEADELKEEIKSLRARVDHIENVMPHRTSIQVNSTGQNVQASCARWYSVGVNETGYMMVDPDGVGGVEPFLAYCNMSGGQSGRGIPTEIHHDIMAKRKIESTCAPAQCFTQVVKYMATKEQMEALLQASSSCSQYIRYDCFNSVLFHVANHYAAWYSRDGEEMTYWGGAMPGTDKCACGLSNSCANPSKRCNCDSNDAVWRADYGYLWDKNAIPVSMMKFGDLDQASEQAFFTLGPLVCH